MKHPKKNPRFRDSSKKPRSKGEIRQMEQWLEDEEDLRNIELIIEESELRGTISLKRMKEMVNENKESRDKCEQSGYADRLKKLKKAI